METNLLLPCNIINHPLWTADKTFTKGQAFLDLKARGDSFKISISELKTRWNWSARQINSFFKKLHDVGLITIEKTIITICKSCHKKQHKSRNENGGRLD